MSFKMRSGKHLTCRVAFRTWLYATGLAAALAAPGSARAQFTWTSTVDGTWNTAGNWTPGVPTPGLMTTLTFGAGPTQAASYIATNDIGAAGTAFDLNVLTINNTSGTVTIAGNPLNLTGTTPRITVEGAGNLTVSAPVTLSASASVTSATAAGTGAVTISGAITGGANNLVKT